MTYTIQNNDGSKLAVSFFHTKDHRQLPYIPAGVNLFRCERATVCKIMSIKEEAVTHDVGFSFQSKMDIFDAEKGRKLALRDALRNVPKPLRVLVWGKVLTGEADRQHKRGR